MGYEAYRMLLYGEMERRRQVNFQSQLPHFVHLQPQSSLELLRLHNNQLQRQLELQQMKCQQLQQIEANPFSMVLGCCHVSSPDLFRMPALSQSSHFDCRCEEPDILNSAPPSTLHRQFEMITVRDTSSQQLCPSIRCASVLPQQQNIESQQLRQQSIHLRQSLAQQKSAMRQLLTGGVVTNI